MRQGLTSYGDAEFSLFLRKAFIKAMGLSDDTLDRPIVGITNTFSDFNPCHGNLPDLLEAVKRVSLVAERNTPIRLKFADGQVTIEAGTGDDAQASEAVESTLTGPEIEIAFNPHFLLDGLGAVGTAYSRLSFTQPSRPAVLSGQAEPDGEADQSYRYVLMPVRFAS